MQTIELPSGASMPKYGMGTWHMGERAPEHRREADALRAGLEAGAGMIDTAEMYANGGAERVVADAIAGRRDEVYLVSKVLPSNAGHADCLRACERSLERLGTDRLDLYLYHWPGGTPFEETLRALLDLQQAGKVIDIGVSNFDVDDLREWLALDTAGRTAVNQIYYNLATRAAESAVIPLCRKRRLAVQAYSPIEQGGAMLDDEQLGALAADLGCTPAQLAIAWLYAQPGVVPLPKTAQAARARENVAATAQALEPATLAALEEVFAAPVGRSALPML